ncbi:uncharacterized protein LOC102809223, partial [Saccoglossus kowalevskii]|uniref:Uncharacterized protein LOC102809223 n=1 Tax=Saccoglossus kowalevskii TaxID=10224 RepID=A0ABM0MFH2_SACKO
MQTVVLVAFFGFLRCGEFTVRSYGAFNREFHLCIEDVSFQGDAQVFLRLKSSKSDQFREGVVIRLFRNDRMCPVQSLKRYLSLRVALRPRPSLGDPLFVTEDNLPLTRSVFLQYLRRLVCSLGLSSFQFTGHSFRIGAATSAANAGIQDHMIKALGRWSSDSYL